jgi:hypothetical protein
MPSYKAAENSNRYCVTKHLLWPLLNSLVMKASSPSTLEQGRRAPPLREEKYERDFADSFSTHRLPPHPFGHHAQETNYLHPLISVQGTTWWVHPRTSAAKYLEKLCQIVRMSQKKGRGKSNTNLIVLTLPRLKSCPSTRWNMVRPRAKQPPPWRGRWTKSSSSSCELRNLLSIFN